MTSVDFIKEVARDYDVTQKAVKEWANIFDEALKKVLSRGESVKFADINFSVRDVEAHKGRNPATGEEIDVPATKKVVVKPSSTLKKVVK